MSKSARWLPAAAVALCALALGLSMNVASTLVPDDWSRDNALWIWIGVGVLGLLSIVLAMWAARSSGSTEPPPVHVTVKIGNPEPEPAPAEGEGQIVVGELPGAPPAPVSRDAVERVAEALAAGKVAAVTGSRGTGKTQVAAAYARRAAADGIELVAWVGADDRDDLLAGLAEVARRLEVDDPSGDSERSAALLRDVLAARAEPAVLVLDDATDPQLVRRYLPGAGATRVIVTSSDRAFRSIGTEIHVGVFERRQSVAYLVGRTRREDDDRADAVAAELGDLPLALAQAATVIELQDLSYGDYLARLRSRPLERILPADPGDAYPHGVAAAILMAIDAVETAGEPGLTTPVLNALALLSADGVSREVLADIAAIDRFNETVGRLVRTSLLVWADGSREVVMHRLVGRAVRDRLERAGELQSVLTAAANGLRPRMVPEDEAWRGREASEEIVGHAFALWEIAASATERGALTAKDLESLAFVPDWAVAHLIETADLSRAIDAGAGVLEVAARVFGPTHPSTLRASGNLGRANLASGRVEEAVARFKETLALCERELGTDDVATLKARTDLACAFHDRAQPDRAIPLLEETLAAANRLPEREALVVRYHLAGAYASEARGADALADAISYFKDAAERCELSLGADDRLTLKVYTGLAVAYARARELDKAIALCERTLSRQERVLGRAHPDTLITRNNLAHALEKAGRLDEAIRLHEVNSEEYLRRLGPRHPHTLSSRNNLASAYESAGRFDEAISVYRDVVADSERVLGPDHLDTLVACNNLGYSHLANEQPELAVEVLGPALDTADRRWGSGHRVTRALRGNYDDAKSAYVTTTEGNDA